MDELGELVATAKRRLAAVPAGTNTRNCFVEGNRDTLERLLSANPDDTTDVAKLRGELLEGVRAGKDRIAVRADHVVLCAGE